jgi:glyoxylase I family protein
MTELPTPEPRRMRLLGLHHVTMICTDLQRTTDFYRDLLGLALVRETVNDDDPDARHFWFGDGHGTAGTLLSFMEYPQMEPGKVGVGSVHHVALAVASADELDAWRDYLRSRSVDCTDVFDRGGLRSIYLRDPDGNIVEIATASGGPTRGKRPGQPAAVALGSGHPGENRRQALRALRRGLWCTARVQHLRERMTLAIGHRAHGLVLRHRDALQELAAARVTPAALTREQVGDRHALRLPRRAEDHVGRGDLPDGHPALELRASQPYGIRPLQSLHVLWPPARGHPRFCVHGSSLLPSLKGNLCPWLNRACAAQRQRGPRVRFTTGWARSPDSVSGPV